MRGLKSFVKLNLILVSLIVVGCSRTTTTNQSGLTSSCTVSGTASANSGSATLSVFCSGGTSPYSISNLTVGGAMPTISGTQSGFSYSTNLTISSSSLVNLQGASGSVTITDASGSASSYTFNILGSNGNNIFDSSAACTLTPSTSAVAANQSITFTAVGNASWGTAPFTFSSFAPGLNGNISQALTSVPPAQANAIAVYSAAGTATPSVTVTDSTGRTGSCSTSVVVSGSSTTGPSCYLTQAFGANNNVTIQAISNDGQLLALSNVSPGANGSIVSSGNPTIIGYSVAGSKTVTATAASASTGMACNGGALMSSSFNASVSSGSGSAMSCSISQSLDAQGRVVFQATSSNGQALAFTNVNAGSGGSIVTNSNPMTIAYSAAGTKTVSLQAYAPATNVYCNGNAVWSNSFYANASSAQQGLSCSYQLATDAYQRLQIRVFASTGEAISIVNVNPGAGGSVASSGNPTVLAYSYGGAKTITLQAYSASRGLWCGNGALVLNQNVSASTGGTTGGALSCTPVFSANPVSRGQIVTAGFQATGGNGFVSLQNISYSVNAGVSGQFINSTQANLYFAYSGSVPMTFTVRDSVGATAVCSSTITVY